MANGMEWFKEQRNKVKTFRVYSRTKGGGGQKIRDQIDLQLRKSRDQDPTVDVDSKSLSPALTDYMYAIPNQEYSALGRFCNDEEEDWVYGKGVLRLFGSKMSEKLTYTLGHIGYKNPNHIYNREFIEEMQFDGYDSGENDEFEAFGRKHYWFNMGLAVGESQVINPPFQFHENDDARTHTRYTKLGRIYAESIYGNMTILSIIPGSIYYHTSILRLVSVDMGMTKNTADYIRTGGGGLFNLVRGAYMAVGDMLGVVGAIGSLVFGGAKMIEFKDRYLLYRSYVNGLLQSMAVNLGLMSWTGIYMGKYKQLSLDYILPGINLNRVAGWGMGWRSNSILNFRCGNDIGVSESFSNSTTSNPLADALNSESTEAAASDQMGNIDKIGSSTNAVMQILNGNAAAGAMQLASNFGNKIMGNFSQLAFIKAGGGKSNFPEIYESSSFSRSYSFNFTFHSPYGDPQSIFENCYIPALLLLALTLPRQVGGFSYIEPFCIRCVVPGLVNINFGIIESYSLERGEQQNDWTVNRIPKTFKVSLQIKDMDQIITMPLASKSLVKNLFPNLFASSGLSEYLVTLSGMSLMEQMDWRKKMGRNFKRWTSGWRGRLSLDVLASTIHNTGIRHILGFFTGMIGTDDVRGQEQNIDKLNDRFVKDGVLENHGQNPLTLIGRWIAKTTVSVTESGYEVRNLGPGEFDSGWIGEGGYSTGQTGNI